MKDSKAYCISINNKILEYLKADAKERGTRLGKEVTQLIKSVIKDEIPLEDSPRNQHQTFKVSEADYYLFNTKARGYGYKTGAEFLTLLLEAKILE